MEPGAKRLDAGARAAGPGAATGVVTATAGPIVTLSGSFATRESYRRNRPDAQGDDDNRGRRRSGRGRSFSRRTAAGEPHRNRRGGDRRQAGTGRGGGAG